MILVRGHSASTECTARQASGAGARISKDAIECAASGSSLETQLGDAGHGANRESLTPRLFGRAPAQEKSGMSITPVTIMRPVDGKTSFLIFLRLVLLIEKF